MWSDALSSLEKETTWKKSRRNLLVKCHGDLCRRAPPNPARWSPRPWLACEYRGSRRQAPGPRGGAARAAQAGAGLQCRGVRGAGPTAGWWPRGGAGRAGHVPAGPLRLGGRAAAGIPGPLCPPPRWVTWMFAQPWPGPVASRLYAFVEQLTAARRLWAWGPGAGPTSVKLSQNLDSSRTRGRVRT